MGDHSEIQWTDATWNPTTGCTRVSAGCDHCYAFTLHDQRYAAHLAGKDVPPQYHLPFSEVQLLPKRLDQPMRWTKPRKIFVDSMADLFHKDVPNDYLVKVFAAMAAAPQHQFQVLTKRPQRMHRFIVEAASHLDAIRVEMNELEFDLCRPLTEVPPPWPLPNVWLGTSVENQEAAYRIDWLVKTPAAVRFLSCEPLLGPLDLEPWLYRLTGEWHIGEYGKLPVSEPSGDLHWVIAGGESGPNFRAMDPFWVQQLQIQCQYACVPFFFKQWGGRTSKAGGRELGGRTWDEMPQVLQAA